ncbi:MAG: SMP-30/gluconolactonase/LRE family protein [Aliidiomarina sp.]|uniref:SMP-30/gluconolactonase/LRE family protein n=1 Tax=Aliidiomarina sp. TaxID=1872439 RepID=UPI0025C56EDC|nr:SMP-30/gluconolactonase/LRE family protein [Aliidiomarina sp.]MCH8502352.1 SMP-30/gluconolactonase/LRE family protein [Aliidiomarina sp.]
MNVFHDHPYPLAEGPLWLPQLAAFFWVDIIDKRVCGKKFTNQSSLLDFELELEAIPTALLHDSHSEEHIWIVTNQGLLHWHPVNHELKLSLPFELPVTHRTNDAGVDGVGNLWIGVMEKKPTGKNGWVFVINGHGDEVFRVQEVGIANTFCYLSSKNSMLVSDSFQQLTFEVPCSEVTSGAFINDYSIWQNLSQSKATPDGGCIDINENVWNAHWDGSCVHQLKPDGLKVGNVDIPAIQVTSCCFGGPDMEHLLITSANDGLIHLDNDNSLQGRIFITKVEGHHGTTPKGFGLKVVT